MVHQRIFYGALLIAAIVGIGWGDIHLAGRPAGAGPDLRHGSLIPLTVVVIAIVGSLEGLALCRMGGARPLRGVVVGGVTALCGLAAVAPLDPRLLVLGSAEVRLGAVALAVTAVGLAQIMRRTSAGGQAAMTTSLFLLIYMGLLPAFIIDLRTAWDGATGVWVVVLFIATVKCTDIGAYFTGLTLGRHKLIPQISPGKTIEGLLGGMACAAGVATLLSRVLPLPGPLPVWAAILFGITMALVGQAGDLVESILKREAGAKDSSTLIPTFGGVLDLLDSPVFAAPVAAILLRAWLD